MRPSKEKAPAASTRLSIKGNASKYSLAAVPSIPSKEPKDSPCSAEATSSFNRLSVSSFTPVALRRSIFDELPAEGQWDHALLIDGNVGIGGDPFATVERAARLVAPGGTVVVELEAGVHGVWSGSVRVESRAVIGPWFPWARAGVGAAREIADQTGLEVGTAHVISGRHLLELHRR